jgi:FkbM family methyltransferase
MRNDLTQLTDLLKPYFKPSSFMEVGSRDGKDTQFVQKYWNLKYSDCHIIEADKISYEKIKSSYSDFNIYNVAASNENGEIEFLSVVSNNELIRGISSIKKSLHVDNLEYEKYIVETIRLDKFDFPIDIMKIDVEGHGYEVLQGLGDKINKIKAIQIETESKVCFENQKVDTDINKLLLDKGFALIDKKPCWDFQFDCLYVNRKL